MEILDFLTTESGEVLTTESGQGILVQQETSNGDIQLFDFSVNLLQALLWEYNGATNLQALLQDKYDWYYQNQQQFWQQWITNVFDLRTANDFGLAVWSIILGQPTFINTAPSPPTQAVFGFGVNNQNFNNGNFGSLTGNTYQFPTEWARLILQFRYFQLVSSGTIPETNRMLKYLLSNYGPAYLLDSLNMTQTYILDFTIPSQLSLILQNFDILPRPAGVQSQVLQGNLVYFGFGGYNANFNNGGFASPISAPIES